MSEGFTEVKYVDVLEWPGPHAERYVIFVCGIPVLSGTANGPVEKIAETVEFAIRKRFNEGIENLTDLAEDWKRRGYAICADEMRATLNVPR